MACVSSGSDMYSAGLIVEQYSPEMPMGWLQARKDKVKSNNKHNLLTLNIWS